MRTKAPRPAKASEAGALPGSIPTAPRGPRQGAGANRDGLGGLTPRGDPSVNSSQRRGVADEKGVALGLRSCCLRVGLLRSAKRGQSR
mgnify:CR=1 FL=1